jgi:hypothetical protein
MARAPIKINKQYLVLFMLKRIPHCAVTEAAVTNHAS